MKEKSLHNTTANGAKKNVKDIQFWGDGDMFKLLCKASSEKEGWMKSTKAMEIEGVGCVVQVTTQQRVRTGILDTLQYPEVTTSSPEVFSYVIAEAVTFVPGVKIEESRIRTESKGNKAVEIVSRKLVRITG